MLKSAKQKWRTMYPVPGSLSGSQPFSLTRGLPTTSEQLGLLAKKVAMCAPYLHPRCVENAISSMKMTLTRLDTTHTTGEMEDRELPEKGVRAAELREKLLEEAPATTGDPLDPFDVELRLRTGTPSTKIDIHSLAKTPDFMHFVISGGLVEILELIYAAREELELPFNWAAPFHSMASILFPDRNYGSNANITEEAAQEIVAFFISKGYSVESPEKGARPLEAAIASLSPNFLKALTAENGASITTRDFYLLAHPPDMIMQSNNWFWDCKLQMLKTLCENEAALDTYKEESKKFKQTLLEIAVKSISVTFSDYSHRGEFLSFIYEKLSDPDRYNSSGNPPIFDLLKKISLTHVEDTLEQYLSTHREILSATNKAGISLLGHCFVMGGIDESWSSQKTLMPIVSILSDLGSKLNKSDIEEVCGFLVYKYGHRSILFEKDTQLFLDVWARFWGMALDSEEGVQNLARTLAYKGVSLPDDTKISYLESCLYKNDTPSLLLLIIEKTKESNSEPLRQLLLNARVEGETILSRLSKIKERLTPHQDSNLESGLDKAIAYLNSITLSQAGEKRSGESLSTESDSKKLKK